ncbi:MAG: FecR family protein [Myxococcota bacterium]
MSATCRDYQASLVDYVRHDLPSLEHGRLQAHLQHCAQCGALEQELALTLRLARAQSAGPNPDELELLVTHLAPYCGASVRAPRWTALATFAVVLMAIATTAALALVWQRTRPAAASLVAQTEPASPRTATVPRQLVRQEASRYLRLVALGAWEGNVETEGRRHLVQLRQGTVAFAFAGGEGRRLSVQTRQGRIEVVGTRFLVQASASGTAVVVAQGRVRVIDSQGEAQVLDAGQEARLGVLDEGALSPTARERLLDDAFLLRLPRVPIAAQPATPVLSQSGAPEVPATAPDVAVAMAPSATEARVELREAERLVGRGEFQRAAVIYERCVTAADPAYGPYRDVAALEWARLLGLRLGRLPQARALLARLSRDGGGEVRSQALLSSCELEGAQSPCAGRRCLMTLVGDAHLAPEVRAEARQLVAALALDSAACDDRGSERR